MIPYGAEQPYEGATIEPKDDEPEESFNAVIDTPAGIVYMSRHEEGVEMCTENACYTVPEMSANEFMGFVDFFQQAFGEKE